jgi:hypothetical protein
VTRSVARIVTAASALALAVGLVPLAASSASAATTVRAPGGLKVARTTASKTTLSITWKPVAGVHHYTVTVFDGTKDTVRVVGHTTTNYSFVGGGSCTHYRVRVSAVMPGGATGTSKDYLVGTLAPGGISGVTSSRDAAGSTATVAWKPPTSTNGKATSYTVVVSQLSTGQVVATRESPDPTQTVPGLDPNSAYVVRVTPNNAFGSCTTGTVLLGTRYPTSPSAVKVTRDAAAPGRVNLSWSLPSWQGYGPVTSYQVGYSDGTTTTWVTTTSQSLSLDLDPNIDWVFRARAISGIYTGQAGVPMKLVRIGAPGTPALDPKVTVADSGDNVLVNFSAPVGSSATFPSMNVAVTPTTPDPAGFSESYLVSNGAGVVDLGPVPCGVYTVTVTGTGAGTSQELGRANINRCQSGLVADNRWKLIAGIATITGNTVTVNDGAVFSTTPRTSQNAVVTTDATLVSGMGYGVWFRASDPAAGPLSGFTIQYDHGWNDHFTLHVWNAGAPCTRPLAVTSFPTNLSINAQHHVVLVASGDSAYVTVDGINMFTVPSLSAVVKSSGCNVPLPTGTSIGLRGWGGGNSALLKNTTIS